MKFQQCAGLVATETRDRIVEAAANAFSKGGFRSSTVRDIAVAAQVNEVTIYRYFPKKSELYWEALDSALRHTSLRENISRIISKATDPAELIESLTEEVSQIPRLKPNLGRLIYFAALELEAERKVLFRLYFDPLFALLVDRIRTWSELEVMRPVDAKTAAVAIVGILLAHCSLTELLPCGKDQGQSLEKAAAEYALFCNYGLATNAAKAK